MRNKNKKVTQNKAAATVLVLSFKPLIRKRFVWHMDKAHARLGFTAAHFLISEVEGRFTSFTASITSGGDDFSNAAAEMTAEMNTLTTDNEKRDADLKSPDFFDVGRYPTLVFKSGTFKKVDALKYKVTGSLTLHGVTRTIELDVVCRTGTHPVTKKEIAGFRISGKLKRSDFGIGSSVPVTVAGDEVSVFASAEFTRE